MTEKRSLKNNYIYNLAYEILIFIVPFVTTPYVSRILGANNIGIYSYTTSIVLYFSLFATLGTVTYGKREIAFLYNNPYNRSKLFYEVKLLQAYTITLTLFFFIVFIYLNNEYINLFWIQVLTLISVFVDISWFFQALEDFRITVLRNSMVKITGTILIFLLVKDQDDLPLYIAIYCITNLIGNITLWLYLPRFLVKVSRKVLEIKKHIKPTLILFIPTIAIQVYTVLNKVMLGKMSTPEECGYYAQAEMVIKLLLTLITSLGVVILPRISKVLSLSDKDGAKTYAKQGLNFALILGFPMMAGIISIADYFVPIFFGDGYDKVSTLMIILSPLFIIIGLASIIGIPLLVPLKREKKYTISVICGAFVSIILNLFMISRFHSIGASLTTIISEGLVTTMQFVYIRDFIVLKDIAKISVPYFVSSVVMTITVLLLKQLLYASILNIIILCISGIIVYFISLVIMRDNFFFSCLKSTFKVLKHS